MDQQEIDRLIGDIQRYLNQRDAKGRLHSAAVQEELEQDDLKSGLFIPIDSRRRMQRSMIYSRFASYAVEVMVIALFTAGILAPFQSWPRTLMFLLGVLIFGIFAITMLLSYQARIELLLRIELNTRNIALSKARIADALEKIQME